MRVRKNRSGTVTIILTPREAARANLTVVTATPVNTKKRYSKADIAKGEGWPCVAGCKRLLQTYERSLTHATTNAELDAGGHLAR